MKRISLHIPLILTAAVAGFVLRSFSLKTEYDAESNLIRRGAPLGIILAILCIAVCAALLFLVPKGEPRRKSAMPILFLFLEVPAAGLLAWSGLLDIAHFFGDGLDSGRLSVLFMGLLSFLASLCVALIARQASAGAVASGYGLYLAVPVFWACLNLTGDYLIHSGNPVLSDYIYTLLAYISITLALFGACTRFYMGRVASRSMPLFASAGVLFSSVALAGPTLARALIGDAPLPRPAQLQTDKTLVLAFILLHSLALLWMASRNALDKNYTPKYKDSEALPEDPAVDIDIDLGINE